MEEKEGRGGKEMGRETTGGRERDRYRYIRRERHNQMENGRDGGREKRRGRGEREMEETVTAASLQLFFQFTTST